MSSVFLEGWPNGAGDSRATVKAEGRRRERLPQSIEETNMKQGKKIPQPNYVRKLHYLYRIGALPRHVGLHMVDVAHDDWCGIFEGQRCDCDPDIRLKYSLSGANN
jgi:hypothetical protein